jgi:hypothetical protein
MSDYAKGDRVRFLGFGEPDPYSRLRVGIEGTVSTVDDIGTVHVDWDDGGRLGMVVALRPVSDQIRSSLYALARAEASEIQQSRKLDHRPKDLGSPFRQPIRVASGGRIPEHSHPGGSSGFGPQHPILDWYLLIFNCDGVLVDSEPTSNRILARCDLGGRSSDERRAGSRILRRDEAR